MPNTNNDAAIIAAKPLTNIFFLVDVSGSMQHEKIDAVNNAIPSALSEIRDFANREVDAKVQCSILTFSDKAKWITKGTDIEDISWVNVDANGGTSLGQAYTQLRGALSRKNDGVMQDHRNNQPIIFVITDGYPTDDAASSLKMLYKNRWFIAATKVAIALPGDIDFQQLVNFTGSNEQIIPITLDGMKDKLQNIIMNTVSASMTMEDEEPKVPQPEGDVNVPDVQPDPEVVVDSSSIDWDELED